MDLEHDGIPSHLNTVINKRDDYLSAEWVTIEDHIFINWILELNISYSNGDKSWHPLNLVKDDGSNNTANYIVAFKRSLNRTIHRLK